MFKKLIGRGMQASAALLAVAASTPSAWAVDDISTVTTTVSGYVTAAIVVGIAVLLFTLGRKVIRRVV